MASRAGQVAFDDAVALVAAALREHHTVTKERAHHIVMVSPEAAARTAVTALFEAGWDDTLGPPPESDGGLADA